NRRGACRGVGCPTVTGVNADRYILVLRAGHHDLVTDEPPALGAGGQGLGPFGLVLASLAACTEITLRMHAARKKWSLASIRVELTMTSNEKLGDRIERLIRIEGDVDDAAIPAARRCREGNGHPNAETWHRDARRLRDRVPGGTAPRSHCAPVDETAAMVTLGGVRHTRCRGSRVRGGAE
ncbi:MAG: OsmC family protein, partial [Pseudonocardiaceae bacterium]